jgi:hypothetical protein
MPATDRATLLLALGLRLVLAPFTGHPFDLPIWFETGRRVAALKSPYDLTRPIGYPGIWPIWLGASSALASIISPGNSHLFDLLIKLPIIAADFLIPNLIVKLVTAVRPGIRFDPQSVSRISRSYLLNPFVIIAGSVWGMPDNIISAGIILALLEIKKARSAGVLFAFSALLKPYPIVVLPALLRYLKKQALRFTFYFLALTGVGLTVPVILLRIDLGRLLEVVVSQTSRFPNAISSFAITNNLSTLYPQIFTTQRILEVLVLPWPIRYLWLEALLGLAVLLLLLSPPSNILNVIAWMRIFAASYYVLFEAVSEQTLIPFIVLCLVDVDSTGHLGKRSTYWLLSAIVTAFLALNVPIWRFLYPIVDITISGRAWDLFQSSGLIVLHVFFIIVILRDARNSWKATRQISH